MMYKIKKKLIHFYTGGSVAEDFVASRRKKVSALRRMIRACFYIHCVSAAVCIAVAVLLKAGLFVVVPISLCALISVVLALFSVGEVMPVKTVLYVADLVFAAAAFISGALLEAKTVFFVCGGIMIFAALAALAAFFAAVFREYLEDYSPRLIRREDYTLLSDYIDEEAADLPPMPMPITMITDEEDIPPLPPLTSEMRELAKQMNDILRADPKTLRKKK